MFHFGGHYFESDGFGNQFAEGVTFFKLCIVGKHLPEAGDCAKLSDKGPFNRVQSASRSLCWFGYLVGSGVYCE